MTHTMRVGVVKHQPGQHINQPNNHNLTTKPIINYCFSFVLCFFIPNYVLKCKRSCFDVVKCVFCVCVNRKLLKLNLINPTQSLIE